MVQLRVRVEAVDLPPEVGVAILECCHVEEESHMELLNAEFFDGESVVIAYLHQGESWYNKRFLIA